MKTTHIDKTAAAFAPLLPGDVYAIERICGRTHVGVSNRAAIECAIARLRGQRKAWRKLSRETRRAFMRAVIYFHGRNFIEYCFVMGGHA